MSIKSKVDFFNNIIKDNAYKKNNIDDNNVNHKKNNNINDKISYWKSISENKNKNIPDINQNQNNNLDINQNNNLDIDINQINNTNNIKENNNIRCKLEYNQLFILNQNSDSENDSENDLDEQTNTIINY